jgi:hypothetical protein
VRRLLPLLAIACSTTSDPAGDPANPNSFDGPDSGTPKIEECAEATKDIFVISEDRTLYSFHPPTLAFERRGLLQCETAGDTPTSMAIDRHGIAWVRYGDGSLWKVDTQTLSCTATRYAPPDPLEPFYQFGMGFSTSSKGGSNEELFLSDTAGGGLAKLDLSAMTLRQVGPYTGDLAGRAAELTGTGDGKLYGFFVTAPAQIAEISKGTGAIVKSTPLPEVYAGNAWAFSFYGGDFYVYTSSHSTGGGPPEAQKGSDVTRFRPSDGSITVVKPKIGFKIVGAGVSTCAPTEGPR